MSQRSWRNLSIWQNQWCLHFLPIIWAAFRRLTVAFYYYYHNDVTDGWAMCKKRCPCSKGLWSVLEPGTGLGAIYMATKWWYVGIHTLIIYIIAYIVPWVRPPWKTLEEVVFMKVVPTSSASCPHRGTRTYIANSIWTLLAITKKLVLSLHLIYLSLVKHRSVNTF